ncbi:kinesin heavy chain-like [Aricia agestis]|uniref:kinesin heavy chain-like n=1 Tax=Aricia agestis TaxID=91739 RepID=UPI001C20A197|nr:kinesin heavy chain-like [Aricia agestis]
MLDPSRSSGNDVSGRDIPSFIEPRPPLILNPFMRPRPNKGTNLLELFEEDSECEEPELVQVYLRLKPCNTKSNLYEVRSERCLITSLDTTTAGHGRRTQHNVSKMYTFSHIFKPDCPQKEIFEYVVKDNLKKLPEGHSFTLLTYGASGSGKTYTLMGTVASPGLVPRSLEFVFNIVEAAQRPKYKPSETGADVLSKAEQDYELQWVKGLRQVSAPLRDKYRRMSASLHTTMSSSHIDLTNRSTHYVWVSFIEIYNEGIYDLLVPCDRRAGSKLAIREDSSGNVYVKGATQAFVKSGEEAYDVMVAGKHNLQVAATGVHAQSSRSHCIFTITMLTEIDGAVRSACVRLCDLAGCERAARTRNTGARMQESRAINSSLHVLERCLHTLRRRQAGRRALVPYRESKLTRLLGAGLSGAKGEAVSMVVTLNPAPEYAHETRHVLQLAAVAKDIQVNNTISEYPSSLETTQDSTLCPSAEVMKLRADNERLRFELARTEAWYKEELARVESQPSAGVDTWALVEEAKQITRQYYEDRILNLKRQNEELAEEQEAKESELLMKITVLEEMLSAEKLARARAEEEVVHLRACIEERDEKHSENEDEEDVLSLDDDDGNSDSETDPLNESLEPTFKKEELNRSKLMRQSIPPQNKSVDSGKSLDNSNEGNESILEKTSDTLKDEEICNDSAVDSTYATGTETSDSTSNVDRHGETYFERTQNVINMIDIALNEGKCHKTQNTKNTIAMLLEEDKERQNKTNEIIRNKTSSLSRSTYCVIKDNSLYESSAEVNTDEISKLNKDNSTNVQNVTADIKNDDNFKVPETQNNTKEIIRNKTSSLSRSTYCVIKDNSLYESSAEVNADEISKLNKDNSTNVQNVTADIKNDDNFKVHDKPFVYSILNSLKKPIESNNSLAQFESLEKAAKDCDNAKQDLNVNFDNIKLLKERKHFFYDGEDKNNNPPSSKSEDSLEGKKSFFGENEDRVKSIITEIGDDYRSPSIVRDECTKDFEPQKIKQLLGENIINPIEPPTSLKKSYFSNKKHESLDVFDSPKVHLEEELPSIDDIRKSIAKVNIANKNNNHKNHIESEKGRKGSNKDVDIKSTKSIDHSKESPSKIYGKEKSMPEKTMCKIKVSKTYEIEFNKAIDELNSNNKECKNKVDNDININNKNELSKDSEMSDLEVAKTEELTETLNENKVFKFSGAKSDNDKHKKLKKVNKVTTIQQVGNSANELEKTTDIKSLETSGIKVDNTLEEFENIYKEITIPRATEFDTLVSQNETQINEANDEHESEHENTKYNLRNKSKTERKPRGTRAKFLDEEVLMESVSKCQSSAKPVRRNLRLRRKRTDDGSTELDKGEKLKDIVNLQSEFSDITMDMPAPAKVVKDIPSPEKQEEENVPPALGIQSCPSKLSTRGRRKLFTPRAEPLDESVASGECDERVRVPRPSYHRPRARRKL